MRTTRTAERKEIASWKEQVTRELADIFEKVYVEYVEPTLHHESSEDDVWDLVVDAATEALDPAVERFTPRVLYMPVEVIQEYIGESDILLDAVRRFLHHLCIDFMMNDAKGEIAERRKQHSWEEEQAEEDSIRLQEQIGASFKSAAGGESLLRKVKAEYPKFFRAWTTYHNSGSIFGLDEVLGSRNPLRLLEACAVYVALTSNGPDVNASTLGKYLPGIRRAVGGDILAAFEDGSLEEVLQEKGLFGRKSDRLRDPADRYF